MTAQRGGPVSRASNRLRRFVTVMVCAGAVAAAPALAEPALWTIQGRHNRVYLFGSVHMLGDTDFAFPGSPESRLGAAYRDAEALIMEVPPGETASPEMLTATAARAIDPDGRGLDDLLGDEAAAVHAAAEKRGIDLAPLAPFEPWFASLVVTVQSAMKQGLAAEHGVEQLVAAAAARDHKPVTGLETADGQLQLFDRLPSGLQAQLLLKTIEESDEDGAKLDELVDAWKRGDLGALDGLMSQEFEEFPELRTSLVVDRNRRWVEQILPLLDDGRDYLIVVGALHLVGADGVPALLLRRGVRATRH